MHQIVRSPEGKHGLGPKILPLHVIHNVLAEFAPSDEIHLEVVAVTGFRSSGEDGDGEDKKGPKTDPKAFYVLESRPVDKQEGIRCDQIIRLSTRKGKADYPKRLRRISYYDAVTGKRLVFLTNHFDLPAATIAAIYKSRWQIELFFKWIKQNPRIKAFYGTSENAVRTQIWIAVCVYLLVACLNKIHGTNESLSRILQILSVNVFQKVLFNELLTDFTTRNSEEDDPKQLTFNGF